MNVVNEEEGVSFAMKIVGKISGEHFRILAKYVPVRSDCSDVDCLEKLSICLPTASVTEVIVWLIKLEKNDDNLFLC